MNVRIWNIKEKTYLNEYENVERINNFDNREFELILKNNERISFNKKDFNLDYIF